MKTLMCSLAAVLSVALGSGTLAAAEDGVSESVVTGTVEKKGVLGDSLFYIEISNFGRFWIHQQDHLYQPKVGEKVRVHYHRCTDQQRDPLEKGLPADCADKIEKVGKAEGGSKKR